jgi:hypothetical protein
MTCTTTKIASAMIFLALAGAGFSAPRAARQPAPAEKGRRAVVVELFTSEGCSSCPPADALLMRLQDQQPVANAEVIALEEHVDYWNGDGWFDPFSAAESTGRQQTYVNRFKESSLFTPEMVIDGQKTTISDEARMKQIIATAASAPATDVSISAAKAASGDGRQFDVRIGPLVAPTPGDIAEVWLAVSETGLQSAVKAGENRGRDLHHAAVLRSLRKIGVAARIGGGDSFTASPQVKFKSNWKQENLQVVVFVQERKSLRILGAANLAGMSSGD